MSSSEWKTFLIGDIGKIVTGKTPSTKIANNFGLKYPFITPRDMSGQKKVWQTERYLSEVGKSTVKNCLLPIDSICVSCIGSDMGKVVMTTQESVTNQQLNSIICNDNFDPEFIYYSMVNISSELKNVAHHSTAVPILNKTDFSNFEFKAPDIVRQKRIASILSDLDEKIELNCQTNQTLEAIAQAIYKEWFINFNFPGATGEMQDSELGPIPKEWRVGKLGDNVQTILGGTPSTGNKSFWENGTVGWINSGKTNEFRIIEPSALITEEALKRSNTKLLPKGTVVLAITGATLGQVSLLEIDSCANQSVVGVIENDRWSSEYLYLYIKTNIGEIIKNQSGGAQQHINKNDVNDSLFLIPDDVSVRFFAEKIKELFQFVSLTCFEIKTLTSIRDNLLPKLMTGEIEV